MGGSKPADFASMTAAQVREKQDRELQDSALRTSVGVKINVARGIIALQERRYEEAGRLMGRVTEDGGMGEWEGTVRSTMSLADDRSFQQQTSVSSRRFAFLRPGTGKG